jgi:CheY-like chemotaxis protein
MGSVIVTADNSAPNSLPESGAPDRRSLRVLVVDDDSRVRDVLTGYLTLDGHVVETAADGREGLARFRAGRFDLVVTDFAMPELLGDQMATIIKREAPSPPVILVTAYGDLLLNKAEHPCPADVIVRKPIRFAAFRDVVASLTTSL